MAVGIRHVRFIMIRRGIFVVVAVLGCALSHAQIALSHNGSTVDIDEFSSTIFSWIVGGTEQVFENSWYFRDGDAGTASLVSTIDPNPTVTLFGTQGAEVVYQNSDLTVTINYFLQANSNGTGADLAEQVVFETVFGIELRLFQYQDFDIAGTFTGDTATRQNSSTIMQFEGDFGVTTGATPIPEFSEMSLWSDVLDDITGTAGYNLNTSAGNGIGETQSGDMTFAFQWNRNLGDRGSLVLSTNKVAAVPEPATFAALALGAAALLRRRKKK